MEKDGFELVTGPAAETGHCENTDQTATEITLPHSPKLHGGYVASRFNAVRHGVLSVHTVLPWEDIAEYESLLGALVEEHAPHGATEEHLVEEIAGVIWRKRRLRLAEAASYQRGLEATAGPFSDTLRRALIQVEAVVDALTQPWNASEDLPELKKRQALAQNALEILSAGEASAYEAALAAVDESTRISWQEQIAPEPEEVEDSDGDGESYTADETGLGEYLEDSVLPHLAKHIWYVEHRNLIRGQVLGEALDCRRLEPLSRYEVHLDRKL